MVGSLQQAYQHLRGNRVWQELGAHIPTLVDGSVNAKPLSLRKGVTRAHNSMPFWALIPWSLKACLTTFISVTVSASSISASGA